VAGNRESSKGQAVWHPDEFDSHPYLQVGEGVRAGR
jgi:hypothetical protein